MTSLGCLPNKPGKVKPLLDRHPLEHCSAIWYAYSRNAERVQGVKGSRRHAFERTDRSTWGIVMRAVIQRVTEGTVTVGDETIGEIGKGLVVLLGVEEKDLTGDADYLADKIANLRIFQDENGKMNRSLLETGGEMLVVSQFTLLGDCKKGRRPSFIRAADPETANERYEYFVAKIREKGIHTETGQFRAMMALALVNDGPVTLILESKP